MICAFCAFCGLISLPITTLKQYSLTRWIRFLSLISPNRKHYRYLSAPNWGLALRAPLYDGAYYEKAFRFPIAPLLAFNVDQCRLWTRRAETCWRSKDSYRNANGDNVTCATHQSSRAWRR